MEHAAAQGFPRTRWPAQARRSGSARRASLRAYVHDVIQTAVGLPRQAVLVGHGAGALVVACALARYPARAAVLAAPVLGGAGTLVRAMARHPLGTLPAVFGGRLRLRRGQLLSREVPAEAAASYLERMGRAGALAQWQLLVRPTLEPPAGDPPVLVLGSPDDAVVPPRALAAAAARYGGAPLLFPGMGHALMLETRWREPIEAICDWLEKQTA